MKTILGKAFISALRSYMEKRRIQQNELAEKLGWSPSDLNDILRGRKNLGKNRQAFLEGKLGESFRQDVLHRIGELTGVESRKPGRFPEQPDKITNGKHVLSDMEQTYVDKLIAILRGLNHQGKLAIMLNIDAFYRHRRAGKPSGEGRFIKQLLKELKE
jgi:transcriptional regulator with XRE-family HTH domain